MLTCAVALILLMDASGSISDQHMRQQQDATARAFVSQQVTDIIARLPGGLAIKAIAFGPWADIIIPWTIILTSEQASNFAIQLRQYRRDDEIQNGTYLGRAINFAIDQFEHAPCKPDEMVIDVSTDGESNLAHVQRARDRAEDSMIRINAIGIGRPELLSLFLYQNVVTTNGFHIAVETWQDFERAIRRKIALEIAQVN